MVQFLNAIEIAIINKNWYSALALSLTLPDICGKVISPSQPSGPRYRKWFDKYLASEYSYTRPRSSEIVSFLTSPDFYALRCSVLHEGTADISHQKIQEVLDKFIITPPFDEGSFHCMQAKITKKNGDEIWVLQLQADIFCRQICQATKQCISEHQELFNSYAPITLKIKDLMSHQNDLNKL